jgi:hypothetical protein
MPPASDFNAVFLFEFVVDSFLKTLFPSSSSTLVTGLQTLETKPYLPYSIKLMSTGSWELRQGRVNKGISRKKRKGIHCEK